MKCNFCGYEWTSRKEKPKACPSCKRYHWNKQKTNINAQDLLNEEDTNGKGNTE